MIMTKKLGCPKEEGFIVIERYKLALESVHLICEKKQAIKHGEDLIKNEYGSLKKYQDEIKHGLDEPKLLVDVYKIRGMDGEAEYIKPPWG